MPPLLLSSQTQLHSQYLYLLLPQQHRGTGNGACSQFIMLSLPLLPPQEDDSSHSSPAWGPSHGKQSSTNYSNMSPSHRLQFHELLQCGSLPQGAVLPANLLQRGLLSLWGHRSCQEPAPVQASHRVTASFGHIHLLRHGILHGLQVDICSTINLHRLQGTACPTMVFTTGCWAISAQVPGAPPPLPSPLTLVSAGLFLSHILTPLRLQLLLHRNFSHFLNTLSQRHCDHR